ncbi:heat shock 70 kDa protein 12A-like [Astyanax mexicanus]|uniref:heat shock 70 kDa protein 12A-like n=1 Tax=Astyanax mexicanus TaxID=7994 RepID=UPI0020CAF57A|nr:heat shock 70 kDa protein 12A-like [Astyanax mexicanus]
MAEVQKAESVVSIAVDFGTAYSGYCFKFKKSKQIRMPKWGLEFGHDTLKTPTCILFDENKQFLNFGYDAIETYNRHKSREEAKRLYLFDNFKMELYGKELNRALMITSKNGKKMRAIKVFSESLKFMKDHALKMIGDHTAGMEYSACDATWVLTVPAIWSPAAKQFMREAAVQAGLIRGNDPERLIVALEPEAASVWCKQLPYDGFLEGDLGESDKIEDEPETQYMVVDCGGGTIDITVHEVMEGGRLKELHKVSGNNMGGQTVDKNFREFLRKTLTEKVFDELEEKYPTELYRLMCDFSVCKRSGSNGMVQCPSALVQTVGEKQLQDCFRGVSGAVWENGSILLRKEKIESFHEDSLRAIEKQIREILKRPELNISYIFVVGGFALSPYVKGLVRGKFNRGEECSVLCPVDAQAAVLKGAVTFSTQPNIIQSRISLYTYGIATSEQFDEIKHKGRSSFENRDGVKFCNCRFYFFVKKDESIRFDEDREFSFCPVERDQTELNFRFYRTESKTVQYVDEEGVEEFGLIRVELPTAKKSREQSVRLKIKFGFTEMMATITDRKGHKTDAKLDFMTESLVL